MSLIRAALSNPVATLVAVLLALLFGLLSLNRLPVQLTPEVEVPKISITTQWRTASPQEIEANIIEPQEKVLRGMPGMTEMLSSAERGRGSVTITLAVGTNLDRSLLEVLNRLNRVSSYPEDANEPILSTVGGSSRPIAWFIVKTLPGNDKPIAHYQGYVEEVIQTRFERVSGVALSEVRGGREQELRITFDPYKAASLGIELPVVAGMARGNEDVTAGIADVGKRRYTIRFSGAMSPTELSEMILEWRDGAPIRLRDVAQVELLAKERQSFVINSGDDAIAVNAHREVGVNVLNVMQGLQQAADELRNGSLKNAQLSLEQVYDETLYIDRSIQMLASNLLIGIILAVGVLWWFLRRFRATMMVAVAIPLCMTVSFFVIDITAHTLNVISLAGLAFAVGMVLDAAIVVLENIVRLREKGLPVYQAASQGAAQVSGALFASTVTTVAIFLPIIFLEDEAGQLFADLALTIAAAVSVSLLVALTVIPASAHQWFKTLDMKDRHSHWWDNTTAFIMRITDSKKRRTTWIIALISIPLLVSFWLKPDADYLPEGNRNLVFAFIMPPPGSNIDFIKTEMGDVIAERMAPYLSGDKQPQVSDYFFVAYPSGAFMGARTVDENQVDALVPVLNGAIQGFPDTLAFAKRTSLFGGFGAGNTIDLNIQGRDIDALLNAAGAGYGLVQKALPGARIRPLPGLALAEPELLLTPDEQRLAEAGWDRNTMAQVLMAMGSGLYVGDYFDGEQRLDIMLRATPWQKPEEMMAMPVMTAEGGVLPLSELLSLERTAGPDKIRRLDRRRTVTLQITPPEGVSLEHAVTILKEQVEPELRMLLPEDGEIRYGGSADKLDIALANMAATFALAVIILYLLISALFRSFKDSLLVLMALPLATVGGIAALNLMPLFGVLQPMDLLTMIGFIILLGLVVNNAILLVHQTRVAEREGTARRDAVEQAVRMRLRPILMSTLTSIFGMLPLLLMPGAGTELYRGMAAVIVGGMLVSTFFTLILLPSLLRLGEAKRAQQL
ncbi:MAG: efflux RND transporter permease subunit [Gammaproteobacteria bacterium]|nr:efflux RND transporter permease subunit [Gammaproteobacteria bacterium]MCF6229902.1 efflux RND transporter permease subunit [Gammaproteobacteria bacterium]